jgi:hypothetical protein
MTLLDAALAYAARNIRVFPCAGKVPAVRGGFHSATTNPETIKRLWRIADRNIGIPTGAVSAFWVVDIDGAEGEAAIDDLQTKHGSLPATREVTTGKGRHLWFRYTGPIQNTASKIGKDIDTRGDGGYVIAPPSVHVSGRIYRWSRGGDLAVAPDWLVQLTRKPTISERALAAIKTPSENKVRVI